MELPTHCRQCHGSYHWRGDILTCGYCGLPWQGAAVEVPRDDGGVSRPVEYPLATDTRYDMTRELVELGFSKVKLESADGKKFESLYSSVMARRGKAVTPAMLEFWAESKPPIKDSPWRAEARQQLEALEFDKKEIAELSDEELQGLLDHEQNSGPEPVETVRMGTVRV